MIAENRVKRANAVVVAVDAVTASTRDLWVSVGFPSFVRAALVWVSKVEVEAVAVVANVVAVVFAVVVSSATAPIVVAGICTPCFRIPF